MTNNMRQKTVTEIPRGCFFLAELQHGTYIVLWWRMILNHFFRGHKCEYMANPLSSMSPRCPDVPISPMSRCPDIPNVPISPMSRDQEANVPMSLDGTHDHGPIRTMFYEHQCALESMSCKNECLTKVNYKIKVWWFIFSGIESVLFSMRKYRVFNMYSIDRYLRPLKH